jgi:carboxypeptidase Taq
MPETQTVYQTLITTTKETSLLGSVNSILGWDERTQLPVKGTEHRANQMSLMSRLIHERATHPSIGEMLGELERSELVKDPASDAGTNVREIRRSYDRKVKLPASLVEEMARLEVMGQAAWVEARKKSDFAIFRPWLEKILTLKKREAECVGYHGSPYNALLDQYEPHERVEDLNRVFQELRGPLVELIGKIAQSGRVAPVEILERPYLKAAQEKLSRAAAMRIGYDFEGGRLDVSVHPFCSTIGPGDSRITTRYDENNFGDAFFSVIHEVGHALYEQGLPKEHWGTPCGQAVSLGIHESQSRMWENLVGRSRAFWEYMLPQVKRAFPEATRDVTAEQWHFAINDVRPSFIRVDSDEATYNLHVLLRYELEQAMVGGDLSVADVPGAWNERMKKYLRIVPKDDATGCLQDIHWSGGAIGYFPTYTLGNLYAAQFFEQANKEIGDLERSFKQGEFAGLLEWLRVKIHRQGQRFVARDLVKRVTGRELSAKPLLEHLGRKAEELYGV